MSSSVIAFICAQLPGTALRTSSRCIPGVPAVVAFTTSAAQAQRITCQAQNTDSQDAQEGNVCKEHDAFFRAMRAARLCPTHLTASAVCMLGTPSSMQCMQQDWAQPTSQHVLCVHAWNTPNLA